jgi:hypothetical protein
VVAHYPNSLPAVAGETVLDKTDFQLARSSTTANSWTPRVGYCIVCLHDAGRRGCGRHDVARAIYRA